jgi:hypothetical protein
MATNEEQSPKRTPFSARLPQASLNEVIPVVEALAALGTPSTPHVIAQQMGVSYTTNARFRTRIGAAGYYGLIEKDGDRRRLTSRGEAITSGNTNAVEQARREAVMSTTFGPVIHSLRGRTVDENTVALRLQQDYGVPQSSAPNVARALVDAATQAELIADDRFDAAAIEAVASVMPSKDEQPARQARESKAPKESQAAKKQESVRQQPPVTTVKEEQARPFVPGVQVVVKIDASSLSPTEIAELVRTLQAPTEPDAS